MLSGLMMLTRSCSAYLIR